MRHSTRSVWSLCPVAAAVAAIFAIPVAAQTAGTANQPADPLGSNGAITDSQEFKLADAGNVVLDVARLPSGEFLVLYRPGGGGSLWVERHANSGEAVGDPVTVSSIKGNFYNDAKFDVAPNGAFAVAWSQAVPGQGQDVYARAYSDAVVPVGPAQQVNTFTSNDQELPDIAIDPDGDYVVVWESEGQDGDVEVSNYGLATYYQNIYGQRFDVQGNPQGSEFLVNTTTERNQTNASVGMDRDGNFVVSFSFPGIRFQRFAADGTPLGTESDSITTSNSAGASIQEPVLAVAPGGSFAIAWRNTGADRLGAIRVPQLRRFDSQGQAIDDQSLSLGTYFVQGKTDLDIATDAKGNVAVVWASFGQKTPDLPNDFVLSTYGRLVKADSATPFGDREFAISDESLAGDQEQPQVAMDADGDFVVVWRSSDTAPDDDGNMSNDGLFAQRYVGPEPVDLSATLTVSPDSVQPDGSVTYTATVTNTHDPVAPTGNDEIDSAIGQATGLNASIELPGGAVAGSVDSDDWRCPSAGTGGTVLCTFQGALAAGADTLFQLPTTAPPGNGSFNTILTVTSAQFDPGAGDDDSNNIDQTALTVGTGGGNDGGNDDGDGDNGNNGDGDYDGVGGNDGFPVQGQDNFDGGGCTLGDGRGPFDPLFPSLMLAAGLIMIRRRLFGPRP